MKKALYFILIIAELVVGFLLMSLAWTNTFEIACIIVAVIWAILMVWQIVLLAKTTDAATKGKIKRNIALIMLIPIIASIAMFICLIVGLSSVI